jgi:hypothetical protein
MVPSITINAAADVEATDGIMDDDIFDGYASDVSQDAEDLFTDDEEANGWYDEELAQTSSHDAALPEAPVIQGPDCAEEDAQTTPVC